MFPPMAGFSNDTAQAVFNQLQNFDKNESAMALSNIQSVGVNTACVSIIQQTGLSPESLFADSPVHIHRHKASLFLP